MQDKKYLDFLKEDIDKYDKITILVRDPEQQLVKMINHIKGNANIGHSFEVVVDPDEGAESFDIDGDGPFYIKDIKLNEKEWKEKK